MKTKSLGRYIKEKGFNPIYNMAEFYEEIKVFTEIY
jgi:hypothetical protein